MLTNRNVVGESTWDVGVLNNHGGTGSYTAEHVYSSLFSFGDSVTFAMATGDYLDLREFRITDTEVGFVSVTVDVDPADGPLMVGWLPGTFDTGALTSYSDVAATTDHDGRARLDLEIPDTGYNCLVIWREPRDGNEALNYTLEIQATPPDFQPLEAAAGTLPSCRDRPTTARAAWWPCPTPCTATPPAPT